MLEKVCTRSHVNASVSVGGVWPNVDAEAVKQFLCRPDQLTRLFYSVQTLEYDNCSRTRQSVERKQVAHNSTMAVGLTADADGSSIQSRIQNLPILRTRASALQPLNPRRGRLSTALERENSSRSRAETQHHDCLDHVQPLRNANIQSMPQQG